MKLRLWFCCTLTCALALVASRCGSRSAATASASEIPHLRKHGTATQLIVDGKPFLALAGELNNNGATSVEYMKPRWSRLVESKLNTVLAGVSWAQIEPQEGKFDFSVPDGIIRDARSHKLRLVLLWFATWKNGSSSYPPDWVKKDFERFPRAQIAGGADCPSSQSACRQPGAQTAGGRGIELLSPFSDASRDADARAFAALMRHVREIDGRDHTVIMIQVENEVGMAMDSRDRSPAANQAYAAPVPKELMDYLQAHKDTLIPDLHQVWETAGFKTSGTWQEVFGKGAATDDIFMAWNYARYVGRVVEAGKAEYPIPMYMNTWLVGFTDPVRASGSPKPALMDVWRAGAPRIDIYGVDCSGNFAMFCAKYTQSGNPLFIPETAGGVEGAARAFYAFGHHDAVGFSRMSGGIERPTTLDNDLIGSYDLIAQLTPLIVEHQGDGTMSGVLLGPDDPPQKVQVGNYTLEASYFNPMRPRPGQPRPHPPEIPSLAGAIFIATGPDEFFAAGNGVLVKFSPNTPGPPFAAPATVEEGAFVDDRWVPQRRLAGDDALCSMDSTAPGLEGECVTLRWPPGGVVGAHDARGTGEGIQRFTLYRYR